jgi:hypothetical protein
MRNAVEAAATAAPAVKFGKINMDEEPHAYFFQPSTAKS